MFSAHVAFWAECYQVSQFVGFLVTRYSKVAEWDNVVNGWILFQLLLCCAAMLTDMLIALQSLASLRQPIWATIAIGAAFPKRMNFTTNVGRMPVATALRIAELPFAAFYPIALPTKWLAALFALSVYTIPTWIIFADCVIVPALLGTKLPIGAIARRERVSAIEAVFFNFLDCSAGNISTLLRTVVVGAPNRVRKILSTVATGSMNHTIDNIAARITVSAFHGTVAEFLLSWGNEFVIAKTAHSIDFLACTLRFAAAISGAKLCRSVRGLKRTVAVLANVLHKETSLLLCQLGGYLGRPMATRRSG